MASPPVVSRAVGARKVVAAVAGFAALAALVMWAGPATVMRQLSLLRWVLPAVLLTGLLKHVLRSMGWRLTLHASGVELPWRELLKARISSQAFAYVSGMGLLVSEPLRPWLLRGAVSVKSTLAASLVESTVYWLTSVLVTVVGAAFALQVLAPGQEAAILVVAALVVTALMVLLLSKRPLLPALGRLGRRSSVRGEAPTRWQSRIQRAGEVEADVRSFRVREPRAAAAVLGVDLLVQVVMLAEVWLVLQAVGVPVTWLQLAAIEAGSRTVKMLSFYLPGRVGADEAGAVGTFVLLGLDPAAGVGLAIAKRVQGVFWTAVGLTWLGATGAVRRMPVAPESAHEAPA